MKFNREKCKILHLAKKNEKKRVQDGGGERAGSKAAHVRKIWVP